MHTFPKPVFSPNNKTFLNCLIFVAIFIIKIEKDTQQKEKWLPYYIC